MGKKKRKVNLEETNQHMLDEEEYSALLCARKSPEVVSAAITNSGFVVKRPTWVWWILHEDLDKNLMRQLLQPSGLRQNSSRRKYRAEKIDMKSRKEKMVQADLGEANTVCK